MTRAVTCRSAAAAAAAAAAAPIAAAAAAAASDLLSAQPLDNKTRVFFIKLHNFEIGVETLAETNFSC